MSPCFCCCGVRVSLTEQATCVCHGPCISKERGRILFLLSVFILMITVCMLVLLSFQGREAPSFLFCLFSCNLGDCFLTCDYVWFPFNKTFHFCNFISDFLFFSSFVSQRSLDTISLLLIRLLCPLGHLCYIYCVRHPHYVLGSSFKCIAG